MGTEVQFASASTIPVGGTVAGGTVAGATVDVKAPTPDAAAMVDATTNTTTAPTAVQAATASTPSTTVLGESITRPSALARTGAGVGGLALLGGLLCGGGRIAILARRFLRLG